MVAKKKNGRIIFLKESLFTFILFIRSTLEGAWFAIYVLNNSPFQPGRVAQSVGHLTRKSEVLGSIPGLATYFRFSFR